MSKKKKEGDKGNIYDRIFKENAESLFLPIIEQELGIKIIKYQALQEKITRTIEREMDFVYRVKTADEKEFLLHIEFQVKSEKDMIYRMGEYHALIMRKYRLPTRHIVVFLGKGRSRMRKTLGVEEQFRKFDLINIYELDSNFLLSSQVPEVILLSILSQFDKRRTEVFIRLIVKRLKAMSDSPMELTKYVNQLTMLGRMRNLEQEIIKIISDMGIIYDVEQDGLYIQGMEKGVKKGEKRGLEKGLKKGIEQGIVGFYELGTSIEKISQALKITTKKVEEVLQKHKKLK